MPELPSKTINREELYELVWSKPAFKLAKEFGISDVERRITEAPNL